MTLLLIGLAVLVVLSTVVTLIALAGASDGFEDESGFHFEPSPQPASHRTPARRRAARLNRARSPVFSGTFRPLDCF
jgi:hypothetical protein